MVENAIRVSQALGTERWIVLKASNAMAVCFGKELGGRLSHKEQPEVEHSSGNGTTTMRKNSHRVRALVLRGKVPNDQELHPRQQCVYAVTDSMDSAMGATARSMTPCNEQGALLYTAVSSTLTFLSPT